MAYVINKWDGSELSVIQDGTLDLTLDIKLVGKNYAGYGEIQNESFLHLLENFSGIAAPPNAIKGQIWYDSAEKKIKLFTGDFTGTGAKVWKSLNAAEISDIAPTTPSTGELWFDNTVDQLKVWVGTEWVSIGPQNAGEGITQMVSQQIKGTDNIAHQVIAATVGNQVIAIISKDNFDIDISVPPAERIAGFDTVSTNKIQTGINLAYTDSNTAVGATTHVYRGNASNALKLGGYPAQNFIDLLQGNFTLGAKFPDAGIAIGNEDNLKIYVDAQNFIYLESQFGSDIRFNVNNTGTMTNPVTVSTTGLIPGANNTYNLGAISPQQRIWKNVYAESFKGTADRANLLQVGSEYRAGSVNSSIHTVVVRDGDAAITATRFIGLADSATKLETPRTINGVSFDGQANISIFDETKLLLSGGTLTGVLTLNDHPPLPPVAVGQENSVAAKRAATKYYVDQKFGTGGILPIASGGTGAGTEENVRANLNLPTRTGGDASGTWNIAISGNASTATLATKIAGGAAGSLLYQSALDTTAFLALGTAGQVLTSNGSSLQWAAVTGLAAGSSALIATSLVNSGDEYRLLFKNGTLNNNASVYFDSDLKYNAGTNTITANLVGQVSGDIMLTDQTTTVLKIESTAATCTFSGISEKARGFNSSRTVSLTGLVTGTSSWDGTGNLSITTSLGGSTVIALGTNTSGNYLASLVAGSHIVFSEGAGAYTPGEGNNVTITVDADSANAVNKVVRRDSNGDFAARNITAQLFDGTAAQAKYADLAEKYLPDQEYEAGTVVSVGGDKEITASVWGDRALGVISTNPAYMMNKDLEGGVYVALKGRVPCKVLGSVRKGQRLVAGNNGYAVPAVPHSNDVFAIALESSNDTGVKVIEVAVL